jgi:CheY-like chemotaxis protein
MQAAAKICAVLAVDDDRLVLELIEMSLQDGGFEVVTAISAEDAFSILTREAGTLSALVTDVNLSRGVSGWDVARRARELSPHLPVVYLTGDSGHEWAAHGVPKSLVVQKPFVPAQLVTAVATLMNDADTNT